MTQTTRKLLNIESVAEKLDCSRRTFQRNRQSLETIGFPMPCLENDEFGGERWDEKAIDLWLDTRMPERFRNEEFGHVTVNMVNPLDMEAELHERARSIRL